jgi:hypothetical protein
MPQLVLGLFQRGRTLSATVTGNTHNESRWFDVHERTLLASQMLTRAKVDAVKFLRLENRKLYVATSFACGKQRLENKWTRTIEAKGRDQTGIFPMARTRGRGKR